MVPTFSAEAYQAARHGAALLDRSARGRIVVSGADRASYLHGLMTNDIAALRAGAGCYTAYLTPQGRMIADMLVYELGDMILLTMDGSVKDTVLAKLDQFIFTEDVKLVDATSAFAELAVIGPDAAGAVHAAIEGVSVDTLSRMEPHANVRGQLDGHPAIVARITDAGEPGYDVYVERQQAEAFVSALMRAGVLSLDKDTAGAIRIEAGMPAFRLDMDEETIPLEAGIESRAISFSKGCYVGQEVIIRVLHRGHGRVARKLVGLTLSGSGVPPPGTAVRAGDREIGHLTSSAMSPALQRPIALGYVHRDFIEPGTSVVVDGAEAVVTALPFV